MRWKAPVHAGGQPVHVEQHVDRHDHDEDGAEEERHDGEARPLRPVQRLRRVLLDVLRADRVQELRPLLLDLDPPQVMRVQPVLEAFQVLGGAGPGRVSGRDRKVVVDPVAGVARLLHHDRGESEDRECEDGSERQVHDRDREPARDPHSSEPPHQRVEQEGDEERHEEEEDHVTHRSRHHPDQQKQERQPDELHPSRNLDPRRRGARRSQGGIRHPSDGIARARRIRDGAWDWSFLEDGAVALDRHELWVEPPVRSRRPLSQAPPVLRLPLPSSFDTVPRDMPRARRGVPAGSRSSPCWRSCS